MNDLGLIDEDAAATMQFDLVTNWMEGNHPAYTSLFDDVDALVKEHDKIEQFFAYQKSQISESSLRAHHNDLKNWLRKTDEQIAAYTSQDFEIEFASSSCACQRKAQKACCCKKTTWLLWLALAMLLLILINMKHYLVAVIYAVAVLVLAQPKFLKDVL